MTYSCPFCSTKKTFVRESALLQHQQNSPKCAALRDTHLHNLATHRALPPDPYESESDPEWDDRDDGFGPNYDPPALTDAFGDLPPLPSSPPASASPPASPPPGESVLPADIEEPDEGGFYEAYAGAAAVIGKQMPPLEQLYSSVDSRSSAANPYTPYFKSEKDWELALWAKTRSVTNEAIDSLLKVPGLVNLDGLSYRNSRELNQVIDRLPIQSRFSHSTISVSGQPGTYDVFHCNPLDVIQELVADPTFTPYMTWGAEARFSDEAGHDRLASEVTSSPWMWEAQASIPVGGTVLPVIISTDKTQLSGFSGEHSAYPVYMTIGNIAKHIRRQPSHRAYRLIGYLPTLKPDETNMSADQARVLRARLFHKAMEVILRPLFEAARSGVALPDADGNIRSCHPLLVHYVADYPEQCLVTCIRYGQTCPKCYAIVDNFGNHRTAALRRPVETIAIIGAARRAKTAAQRERLLKSAGLNNYVPFWADWPFANIHAAISPDGLHQVIQGVGAHLINWLTAIVGEKELDARMSRLPPAHDLRHFARGISGLSRVSGTERKAIYAQILGAVIGRVPRNVLRATRALLDVIYIGQFECHSNESLKGFRDALDTFHKHKAAFKRSCPDIDFNFPKLHMLDHWAEDILMFGTYDNCNTEATERMHIEFAKDAFKASNRRDYIIQMCRWLQRRQAVHLFAVFLGTRTGTPYEPRRRPLRKGARGPVSVTATPQRRNMSIDVLAANHAIPGIKAALRQYLQSWHGCSGPTWTLPLPVHVENGLRSLSMVDVWHSVRFETPDLQTFWAPPIIDIARAMPEHTSRIGNNIKGRFDTVLVETKGDGVAGVGGLGDVRAARLRAIIRLPAHLSTLLFRNDDRIRDHTREPPEHLAIVTWYTPFTQRNPDSLLFKISQSYSDPQRTVPQAGVVDLLDLRRTCHLFPDFGADDVDRAVESDTALDAFEHFRLNDFVDKHAYRTM